MCWTNSDNLLYQHDKPLLRECSCYEFLALKISEFVGRSDDLGRWRIIPLSCFRNWFTSQFSPQHQEKLNIWARQIQMKFHTLNLLFGYSFRAGAQLITVLHRFSGKPNDWWRWERQTIISFQCIAMEGWQNMRNTKEWFQWHLCIEHKSTAVKLKAILSKNESQT